MLELSTFECTFCEACAESRLHFKCPNCGGELVRRPIRRAEKRSDHPASTKRVFKPAGCAPADGT